MSGISRLGNRCLARYWYYGSINNSLCVQGKQKKNKRNPPFWKGYRSKADAKDSQNTFSGVVVGIHRNVMPRLQIEMEST